MKSVILLLIKYFIVKYLRRTRGSSMLLGGEETSGRYIKGKVQHTIDRTITADGACTIC